jgi:hypothetical protein
MKRSVVAALGAAIITTLGASSAAQAALIDFFFSAGDGSITYAPATSLDVSSALDLDGALMLVLDAGKGGDDSGLTFGNVITLSTVTPPGGSIILYGDTTPVPPGGRPLGANVILSWPMAPGPGADTFIETLTTVTSINRGTTDAIAVTMTGTVSDHDDLFMDAPVQLIMTASQAGGSGTVGVEFTNTTRVATIPEPSTWVMMTLGFGTLGCAAFRRRKANVAVLSA